LDKAFALLLLFQKITTSKNQLKVISECSCVRHGLSYYSWWVCGNTSEIDKASTMPCYFKEFGTNRDAENWGE
jgi:hypothetical protein